MNGEDFKSLIKSAQLNEIEVGNILGCTRENVFKIYKKKIIKNAYVEVIKAYINNKGSINNDNIKLHTEKTIPNYEKDLIELLKEQNAELKTQLKELNLRYKQSLFDSATLINSIKDLTNKVNTLIVSKHLQIHGNSKKKEQQ